MKPPQVRIGVASSAPDDNSKRWRVTWFVRNDGDAPLRLEDAWLPHGRFRGDGHQALAEEIAPGGATRLTFSVISDEAPGTVVENAFLILRTSAWRLFARMRVEFDGAGAMTPIVEVVTAQSIQ